MIGPGGVLPFYRLSERKETRRKVKHEKRVCRKKNKIKPKKYSKELCLSSHVVLSSVYIVYLTANNFKVRVQMEEIDNFHTK